MSIVIDLALVAIIVVCAWRGFRTGIINGVCWILAIVIAVYGANLASNAYYNDFADMFEQFAVSVVESTMNGDEEDDDAIIPSGLSAEERQQLDVYEVSLATLERLGIAGSAAEPIAREVAATNDHVNSGMTRNLTALLCDRLAFVVLFAIAFALISIIFTVIGNIFDLSFGIPGHENLNHITGAALGIIRGIMIVMVLACLGRYLGLLIPEDAAANTRLWSMLVETNRLAELLNI